MHDPLTVAHEIRFPWREKPSKLWPKGYRHPFITIWHKDPERRGSDDSCGWFKRAHHGDPKKYEKITKEIDYDWDLTGQSDDKTTTYFWGWFHPSGEPMFSPIAIAIGLFHRAALIHFDSNWDRTEKFMQKNLYRIMSFAENPHDSMHNTITNKYRGKRDDRVEGMACMIYGCILRWDQKWWQHPKWHIHHWRIQIHPLQDLWHWLTRRCCHCRKGFKWKEAVLTNWGGQQVWHERCDRAVNAVNQEAKPCSNH